MRHVHAKIRVKITFDLHVWYIKLLLDLIESLPGVREVELEHVYKVRELTVWEEDQP